MADDKETDASRLTEEQVNYLDTRRRILSRIIEGDQPRLIASNLGLALGRTFMHLRQIREKYGGSTYEEFVENVRKAKLTHRKTDA